MPSVIGTDSLSGINVAANYLKAAPSTQFGTRQLSVITLTVDTASLTNGGDPDEYLASDSNYSKVVRALQQTAEVWAVFTPLENGGSSDSFNAIISTDSQFTGNTAHQGAVNGGGVDTPGGYGVLETALTAGSGLTVTVANTAGFVAPFHG